MQVHISHFFSS